MCIFFEKRYSVGIILIKPHFILCLKHDVDHKILGTKNKVLDQVYGLKNNMTPAEVIGMHIILTPDSSIAYKREKWIILIENATIHNAVAAWPCNIDDESTVVTCACRRLYFSHIFCQHDHGFHHYLTTDPYPLYYLAFVSITKSSAKIRHVHHVQVQNRQICTRCIMNRYQPRLQYNQYLFKKIAWHSKRRFL